MFSCVLISLGHHPFPVETLAAYLPTEDFNVGSISIRNHKIVRKIGFFIEEAITSDGLYQFDLLVRGYTSWRCSKKP